MWKRNKKNKEIVEIFDEEESNIHLIQLKGKIVRDGDCPINKSILCEDCEFYDGWGYDMQNYKFEVFCNNPNVVDAKKLKLKLK